MFACYHLKREGRLTGDDLAQIGKCRRPQNRLGFAYQLAFVRLLNRFPKQQPFEVIDDLVNFIAVQLGVAAGQIDLYRNRKPTISEHQQTITGYLGLRTFSDAEATLLEKFVFDEACGAMVCSRQRAATKAVEYMRHDRLRRFNHCKNKLQHGLGGK